MLRLPNLCVCFVHISKPVCLFCPVCQTCIYVLTILLNLYVCFVHVSKPVCMFCVGETNQRGCFVYVANPKFIFCLGYLTCMYVLPMFQTCMYVLSIHVSNSAWMFCPG